MIIDHHFFFFFSLVMGGMTIAPYVRAILRRETRPHMFSWLIWAMSNFICCAVQFTQHGGIGSWCMLINGMYCLGITVASFWIGTRDIRRIDWLVLAVTLSALPLWWATHVPIWSVVLVTIIDGLGYIPTIRKSWERPGEESALSWAFSCVVFASSALALENYTLTNCLYPITFAVVNGFFVAFLLVRRKAVANVPAPIP